MDKKQQEKQALIKQLEKDLEEKMNEMEHWMLICSTGSLSQREIYDLKIFAQDYLSTKKILRVLKSK